MRHFSVIFKHRDEGSKYDNFGCKKQDSQTLDSFHCVNRQDKGQVLFVQPPVPLKQTNRGRNYNKILEYDESYVYCNEQSRIAYAEIWDLGLSQFGTQIECHLKNGENLTLRLLFIDLALDFSFEMNYKFHEFYHDKLMQQLEDQCLIAPNAFQCGVPNSTYCIYEYKLCDGIANCPNGQDEDYEVCQEHFSTYASIKCHEKDVFNMNITIGATPCDNYNECQGDIDEINCNMSDIYSVFILVFILVITSGLAIIMKKMTLESLEPIKFEEAQSWTQHELEAIHGQDQLKIVMYQVQHSKNDQINQNFIQMEMDQHNGVKSEIVCCIKNTLDPWSTSKVLNKFHGQSETFAYIAKIFEYHWEQFSLIKMILNAALHTMDLAKDSLILIQISLSQGGLSFILEQPTPYVKGMFFFLLASILIPFILGALRFILKGGPKLLFGFKKGRILEWITMVFTIPIFPTFLIMREVILVEASKKYQVSQGLKITQNVAFSTNF